MAVKALKLVANLGYGSRRQVALMFREGRVTDASGRVLHAHELVEHDDVRLDGGRLDPPLGMVLMLHKPASYTCSTSDPGAIIYDLLPPRFKGRSPHLASIGRLDRNTSGLLLLTDDGRLLQRIAHPRTGPPKTYEATLARDLRGDEAAIFASGHLMLAGERTPLAPAALQVLAARRVRLIVTEGRYHQVRRMFAALGNHVDSLHRSAIGGLDLGGLASGRWRLLAVADLQRLFATRGTVAR